MSNKLNPTEMKKLASAKQFYEGIIARCNETIAKGADSVTETQAKFNIACCQSKIDTINTVLTRANL